MSLRTMCARTTGTLKRPTGPTKDASGGMTKTFANVTGYVEHPCAIQPANGSVQIRYMQQQLTVSHTVFTAAEVPAKAGDIWVSEGVIYQFRGRDPKGKGHRQWDAKMHVEEVLG